MISTKGFTLVEIVVVMIIIGILAAIALTNVSSSAERTRAQAAKNNLLAISAAEQKYFEDNSSYCVQSVAFPTCADNKTDLNTNLSLTAWANDSFGYSCSALPAPYTCTATDAVVTLTVTAGANVTCAPAGNNCPF